MASDSEASSITPLRIRKHSISSDSNPSTFSDADNSQSSQSSQHSDLSFSEIGLMANSHNSPLSNTTTKTVTNSDELPTSSPLTSPYSPAKTSSPLAFWQGRDLYDSSGQRENSPSVGRRSSIERLKRASRVQSNAKIFQQAESRTPARPLTYHAGQSSSPISSPSPVRSSVLETLGGRERSRIPLPKSSITPPRATTPPPTASRPTSILSSPNVRLPPTKSSLLSSYKTNSFDTDSGILSEGETSDSLNRSPTRRPKSVTFDKEAPEVLEYETITPDPSVEGSPCLMYDSEDDEDDDELENTPVIEPDGWPTDDIVSHHRADDAFQSSPSANGRPLPPIPSANPRVDTDSSSITRPLPTIPSQSASEIHGDDSAEHEEDEARQVSSVEEVCEPVDKNSNGLGIMVGEVDEEERDDQDKINAVLLRGETSDTVELLPAINEEPASESQNHSERRPYEPPRLSRESIRRQVEERRQQSDDTEAELGYGYAETTDESLDQGRVKSEPSDNEASLYSIPESDDIRMRPASRFATRSPDPEFTDSEISAYNENEDDESRYSESDENAWNLDTFQHQDTGIARAEQITAEITEAIGSEELDPEKMNVSQEGQPKGTEHFNQEPTVFEQNINTENSPPYNAHGNELDIVRNGATPTPSAPGSPRLIRELPVPPQDSRELEHNPRMSLPDFTSLLGDDGLGLKNFMTPSPPLGSADFVEGISTNTAHEYSLQRSSSSDDGHAALQDQDDNDDTGSVIRHNIYHSDLEEEEEEEEEDDEADSEEARQSSRAVREELRCFSPVEEAVATIRAPGGKLKTRASATPADMAAMAAARRHVSGEQFPVPPVPRIPDGYRSEGDVDSSEEETDNDGIEDSPTNDSGQRKSIEKRARKSSALPALGEFEFDLNMDDLTTEFDRVIEKQKRGYLMRQNTRVIHASSRDPDEEEKSPPRPGHARGQSWSVEPWRSSQRRRSQRESSGGTLRKRPSTGPVPPLPGKEGVTSKRLTSVDEDDVAGKPGSGPEENGAERGRLFVKVVGVKDLTLPLPQGQPTYFSLTLDNGLHCVTTSWLELGKNAPIGQEFELVVLNDLEFQLTLQTKIEQPPPPPPKTVIRAPIIKHKQSTFSKVFSTPRKKKQLEQQYQEQLQQQQQEQERQEAASPTSAWDLLHGLVARDGSFARSYVCLKDFESRAYGRPLTTEVHCFNEWAVDTASVKSKKGMQAGLQPARKAPYRIGKLEIQLLFIPKPKNSSDKDFPKSMNSAIREIKEAESVMTRQWEGTLSQQGGDCPYWRRRYFKLNGVRLTAYHEATRQPRATINLSKAVKLIDDRHSLVDPTVSGPGKSRRKSGFSEEEEGYMFVEEGFRIRFGNGEVIDFYADSADDKRGWMKILADTIGRVPDQRGWCQLILVREARIKADQERAENTTTSKGAQSQPRIPSQSRGAPLQYPPQQVLSYASAPAKAARRPVPR